MTHREGESFDRMMVSINRPYTDYESSASGFVQTEKPYNYESTFAHEFAHLLGTPDGNREGSLFVSGDHGDSLTDDDFNELFPRERSEVSPPGAPGTSQTWLTKLSGSRVQTSTIPHFENRRHVGATYIYRWVKRVK